MKNKIILIVFISLVAAGITIKLVANKKKIDSKKQMVDNTDVAIPVNIITTKLTVPDNNLVKSGTLLPFKSADISAVGGGKLASVNFELGDIVQQGAVLATVDVELMQIHLEAAEIARNQAQTEYNRFKALYEGKAVTEQDYQNVKLNYENSENQIKQLQKQIADNQVKAPISGQIILKLKEAGEFVGPGSVLGQMVQVNRLKVGVMVSESEVYSLKKDAPVTITTDVYPGVQFDGKISFISSSGDAVHNYKVEVTLENKDDHLLKAGSFAYVDFQRHTEKEILLIPKSALIESLDKPMVYVVKDNHAEQRTITVGSSYGNDIEVIEGIQVGEKVVVSGLVNISNGTLLNPIEK
ncbi:MAG: efflux RND transporter periplasmic adaptor subunit [Brumimicrobium sp.]|nr:efflux RND transporter periplasmic adaptor subunit [Brumimicrobium sp.]